MYVYQGKAANPMMGLAPAPLVEDPVTKAKPSALSRAFAVASVPAGAKPIEVGQLLLRIDAPAAVDIGPFADPDGPAGSTAASAAV